MEGDACLVAIADLLPGKILTSANGPMPFNARTIGARCTPACDVGHSHSVQFLPRFFRPDAIAKSYGERPGRLRRASTGAPCQRAACVKRSKTTLSKVDSASATRTADAFATYSGRSGRLSVRIDR